MCALYKWLSDYGTNLCCWKVWGEPELSSSDKCRIDNRICWAIIISGALMTTPNKFSLQDSIDRQQFSARNAPIHSTLNANINILWHRSNKINHWCDSKIIYKSLNGTFVELPNCGGSREECGRIHKEWVQLCVGGSLNSFWQLAIVIQPDMDGKRASEIEREY